MTINLVHSFDPEQFDRMLAAIDWSASGIVLEALAKLNQRIKNMAVNVDALLAAVAEVQADVQNVIRKLNEPDVAAQTKIDQATAVLQEVNAALDTIAPDAPAPEPPVEPTPDAPVA